MQSCCSISKLRGLIIPIPSMYGIFTYIYCNNQTNVGKYTIHGWYGIFLKPGSRHFKGHQFGREFLLPVGSLC